MAEGTSVSLRRADIDAFRGLAVGFEALLRKAESLLRDNKRLESQINRLKEEVRIVSAFFCGLDSCSEDVLPLSGAWLTRYPFAGHVELTERSRSPRTLECWIKRCPEHMCPGRSPGLSVARRTRDHRGNRCVEDERNDPEHYAGPGLYRRKRVCGSNTSEDRFRRLHGTRLYDQWWACWRPVVSIRRSNRPQTKASTAATKPVRTRGSAHPTRLQRRRARGSPCDKLSSSQGSRLPPTVCQYFGAQVPYQVPRSAVAGGGCQIF
jgi:hypothetical protein